MRSSFFKTPNSKNKLFFSVVSLPLLVIGLLLSVTIVNQKESIDPSSEAAQKRTNKDSSIDLINGDVGKRILKKYAPVDPLTHNVEILSLDPPQTPYSNHFLNEPLIGMIANNTFQVNLRAKEEGTMVSVQYGIGNLTSNTGIHTSTNANEQYNVLEIPLDGIQAGAQYQYRISWKAPGGRIMMPGPIHTFQSPRAPQSNFKFGVVGDSKQPGHDADNCIPGDLYDSFGILINHMSTQNYDLTLSLGDNWELQGFADRCDQANEFTMENALLAIQHWRDDMDTMHHSTLHFMSPGNHEYDVGWNNNFRVDISHKARLLSTVNPLNNYPADGDNETFYSFKWGNALFISLNSEFEETLKANGHQYIWLRNILTNSNAKWKFVFMHKPLFGSRGSKLLGDDAMRASIMTLFADNGVDVVFQAHDHGYNCKSYNPTNTHRHCYDNLVKNEGEKTVFYVISGGGGTNGPSTKPGLLQYMDVSIQDDLLTVKCIKPLTGNLCDESTGQFSITKIIPTPTPEIPDPEPPPPISTPNPTKVPSVLLNSSTGKSCKQFCKEKGKTCVNVGTNSAANDKTYYVLNDGGQCIKNTFNINCDRKMNPSVGRCEGKAVMWTNCLCK